MPKRHLQLIGVLTIGFGLVSQFRPAALSEPAGFGALSPSAATDLRAASAVPQRA